MEWIIHCIYPFVSALVYILNIIFIYYCHSELLERCHVFSAMLRFARSICGTKIAGCKGWKYTHGGIHSLVTKPDREDVKLVMCGRMILKCILTLCVQMFVFCRKQWITAFWRQMLYGVIWTGALVLLYLYVNCLANLSVFLMVMIFYLNLLN